jgi:hypothetical protein
MDKWTRVASVTTGGKPYFWTRAIGLNRYWVVWNRVARQWVIEAADGGIVGYYSSPQDAMR